VGGSGDFNQTKESQLRNNSRRYRARGDTKKAALLRVTKKKIAPLYRNKKKKSGGGEYSLRHPGNRTEIKRNANNSEWGIPEDYCTTHHRGSYRKGQSAINRTRGEKKVGKLLHLLTDVNSKRSTKENIRGLSGNPKEISYQLHQEKKGR